jgi:hypothetical protein
MSAVPTVRIKAGDSFAVINEDDFRPEVHELWSPDHPPIEQPQCAACTTEPTPEPPEALAAVLLPPGPSEMVTPVESDESYEASKAILDARHDEEITGTIDIAPGELIQTSGIEHAPVRRGGWPKGKKRRP